MGAWEGWISYLPSVQYQATVARLTISPLGLTRHAIGIKVSPVVVVQGFQAGTSELTVNFDHNECGSHVYMCCGMAR